MITVAELAAALNYVFEGCKLKAYYDKTGKVWTIGFGHTRTAQEGMQITYEQAVKLYEEDVVPLLKLVESKPVLEAAALVSFGHNCGIGAMQRLMRGEIDFQYGRTSGGVRLEGLVARRNLEECLIRASKAI